MEDAEYKVGDRVVLLSGEWEGQAGVVSWPITKNDLGYVLVYSDRRIAGIQTSYGDVKRVVESSKGLVQLTYHLIKLSSYLIDHALT
jgi:hypothetical protein